jgi:hypothetical protein
MNGTSVAIHFSVHDLHDIELAALLCLITDQHCIVQANSEDYETVAQELELVARKTFGLSHVIIDCNESLTLEDFGHQVLTTEVDENQPELQVSHQCPIPSGHSMPACSKQDELVESVPTFRHTH